MVVQDLVKNISERIQSTASVKAVYGDPITAEGKTIIPVARVRYGFGAGGGTIGIDATSEEGKSPQDSGGGGGGGVEVSPIGYIEVTAEDTYFISFEERRKIVKAALFGLLIGTLLARRRRRH